MFTKLRSNKGFTLIELLIVVAIIGILAAVAIPQFSKYRIQGFNASANSDLRNIRTSEESLFAEWTHYGKTEYAALPGVGTYGPGAIVPTVPAVVGSFSIISTLDNLAVPRGLQIPVGNNVSAMASTDGNGGSYTLATKHLQGDTVYAADGDSTANYKKSYNPVGPVGTPVGTILQAADVIAPVVSTDEYSAAANFVKM
jgi:prepilin-type N-terminal cleavage/methylation domain-containing protein